MDGDAIERQRGIVEVAGPEARELLQRLITNDVERLAPGEARYAALLSPQGKIAVDFFVVSAPSPETPERFWLDCPADLSADLAKKLRMYKLRANVTVTDRSAELGAKPLAEPIATAESGLLVYTDPRNTALGFRAVGPHEALGTLRDPSVETRRIEAGVPEGGLDFAYGDTFPHEANFDRLNGVDFMKGCYVGQEVVSRMQHRGTTRKRVQPVGFDGTAPSPGAEILAGDLPVGTMGSSAGQRGLAMVRIDRVTDALASGTSLEALGKPVRIDLEVEPTSSH